MELMMPLAKIIFEAALNLSRPLKRVVQVSFDSLIIFLSLCLSTTLRLESIFFLFDTDFQVAFLITLFPSIYVFLRLGLYRAFLRHVSTEVAVIIAIGSTISGGILLAARGVFGLAIPLSVPVIYAAFLFILIAGTRFSLRSLFRSANRGKQQNIAIYGAGAAGAKTFQSLKAGPNYKVRLVIDDSTNVQGDTLFGQKVFSLDDAISQFRVLGVDTVLLAIPSATPTQRKTIITRLIDVGVKVKTIPSLSNLMDGTADITELKNIAVDDLLGREPVLPDPNLMNKAVRGKVILVTGAGGSIGSELCREIIRWQPARMIILDQSEFAVYQLQQELAACAKRAGIPITPVVTSVSEMAFISQTLARFNVDTIYHAAAYKHVPLMEQNVMQGLKNNVFGTKVVAECAIEAGVRDVILISTDKAVNPTNYMGASKRLCELLFKSLNEVQKETCFSIVRFGNVLGSSGSVIPLFKTQIKNGGPVTVTHEDITRYFMTIPEAAQLVIQAGGLATGGEVFVLDMGEPVRIIDLAKKIIQLSGLVPFLESSGDTGDIAIKVIGLRPGEKLYEELTYCKKLLASAHPRILRESESKINLETVKETLESLERAIRQNDFEALNKFKLETISLAEKTAPKKTLYQKM
jgi:FlaA1/EpsC-like NDP-sugar epimerase